LQIYIEHPWCQQSTDYDSGFFTSYFEYIIYYIISKLFRQDIQKYKSLIPHVSAAIQLRKYPLKGDTIQYIYMYTDSRHNNPLCRVTPIENLASHSRYDKEKYKEMILDAAETVLGYFGFDRTIYP
jgi:DNA polymerase elongation subunit (family B)